MFPYFQAPHFLDCGPLGNGGVSNRSIRIVSGKGIVLGESHETVENRKGLLPQHLQSPFRNCQFERNILFFIYFWLPSASNCPLPLIHLLNYVQLYSKVSVCSKGSCRSPKGITHPPFHTTHGQLAPLLLELPVLPRDLFRFPSYLNLHRSEEVSYRGMQFERFDQKLSTRFAVCWWSGETC
jgi:hypothetical protein